MAVITYNTKVALNENQSIADENKCNASDLNEIKSVVNENYSDYETLNNYVDNLGNVTTEFLTVLTSELNPSDWRVCCDDKTVTLTAGTYLFIVAGRFTAIGGSGFVTFRPVIEGIADNNYRSSILMNNFTTDGVTLTTRTYNTDTTITLNLQGYANIKFKCIAGIFNIIKLK